MYLSNGVFKNGRVVNNEARNNNNYLSERESITDIDSPKQ